MPPQSSSLRVAETSFGAFEQLKGKLVSVLLELYNVIPRLYNVSSSDIRQRIREGRAVRRLVPVAIYDEVLREYDLIDN